MINFGYTASESRHIDMDERLHPTIEKMLHHEPSLKECIACGRCAAVCTAGYFTGMQFYRLNLMAHRGLINEMKQAARACMLCGKCQMTCPKGVNIRHGMLLMSQIADVLDV